MPAGLLQKNGITFEAALGIEAELLMRLQLKS